MNKYYWDDKRKNAVQYTLRCCCCRCEIEMTIKHYPHGPNQITACPVCNAKGNNLQIEVRRCKKGKHES
jgi:hypothetical protein